MTDPRPPKTREHFLENDRRKTWPMEAVFEKFLWNSRYLVLFAVLSSLAAAFVLFVMGTFDVVRVVVEMVSYYLGNEHKADLHAELIGKIIGSVDIFLIAVVLLIFSFGLYELFISHIDAADSTEASNILDIASLDVLKDKIGQVILMALIVKFFQVVLSMKLANISEMLLFAGCVALLGVALFLLQLGKHLGKHD
ncbi:MAG: YqhA family protein [Spirochaetales bacterium]